MTQRRVENTRVHFWTFSPVSVNSKIVTCTSYYYRCAQFLMHIQITYTDFIRKKIPKTL